MKWTESIDWNVLIVHGFAINSSQMTLWLWAVTSKLVCSQVQTKYGLFHVKISVFLENANENKKMRMKIKKNAREFRH